MIDTSIDEAACTTANGENLALQDYVQALLARQQALDKLETIQEQFNHVGLAMRKLMETHGASSHSSQSVRAARAARIGQAQSSFRALEKRREECIAELQQAERRSNTALQTMISARSRTIAWSDATFSVPPRFQSNIDIDADCRAARRKTKRSCAVRCQ